MTLEKFMRLFIIAPAIPHDWAWSGFLCEGGKTDPQKLIPAEEIPSSMRELEEALDLEDAE